ncbi:MAG TPA: GMC family oxidoreductase [Pyrinomonadaceae bacterium]|nr:GMC family oxidoreductase [Pyrinomonadaceae bacterium]
MSRQEIYDAVIVGSGATGGWAAKELTEKGLRVAVLEAGRNLNPAEDYTEHKWPYELKYRGFGNVAELQKTQPIQSQCYACTEYGRQFFINDLENPYTTTPGKPFFWIRSRQVGGRTIPWGRQTYRLSNYDFKAKTHDGYGDDWPISYEDLAPYYDRVEDFIGISGSVENLPQLPDSKFLPPMDFTCGERHLKKTIEKFRDPLRRLIIGRAAILTKSIHTNTPEARPACHWCGHCDRGCSVGSYFSSPMSTLPAAARTGRMTLITRAVASHVTVDPHTGRARGVHYVDAVTRQHREVRARAVLLCAGTLESTRLLLNSSSSQYPNGLANSSGVLGHYLMDHIKRGGATGTLPMLDTKELEQDGRANGIYVPRFRNLATRHKRFIRGYGMQGGSGQSLWEHGKTIPGFGAKFKEALRADHPWGVSLSGYGECLARYENHVRIDKDVVDAWGIPALHVEMEWGENEHEMVKDMAETAEETLHLAGATDIKVRRVTDSPPGFSVHEVGTARMGDDSKKSVLNKFNQSWDVKNLFVTDGACYVSNGCQNPTLTMMALTVRACDYLVEELRAGRL